MIDAINGLLSFALMIGFWVAAFVYFWRGNLWRGFVSLAAAKGVLAYLLIEAAKS